MPEQQAPQRFHRHLKKHNRLALALALLSLLLALALWLLLYFAAYWLALLWVTVVRGPEAVLPQHFNAVFFAAAGVLLLLALLSQRHSARRQFRDSKNFWFEGFVDLLLSVPRLTIAAWTNLLALQRLSAQEREAAWRLLRDVVRQEKLPLRHLPVELPEPRLQNRALVALQICDLVELRRVGEEFFLVPAGREARELAEPRKRLRLH